MNTGPQENYKLTPDSVRKLEEAFALGCCIKEACIFASISRDTYYRWIKESPQLSDRFDTLRLEPVFKAKKTIIDSLDDPKVAAWYLERKCREEFGKDNQSTNDDAYLDTAEQKRTTGTWLDEDGNVIMKPKTAKLIEEMRREEEFKKNSEDIENAIM